MDAHPVWGTIEIRPAADIKEIKRESAGAPDLAVFEIWDSSRRRSSAVRFFIDSTFQNQITLYEIRYLQDNQRSLTT
jgi:hypothetical protein